jgi:hypothetical protein
MREPELWIMNPGNYKNLFATHHGGTLATDSGGASTITDPGFVICSGQAWLADAVHTNGTANTVYGEWAAPAVRGLMVSGSHWAGPKESPSAKVVEAVSSSTNQWIRIARTNGITSNQDTTSGIFLVEFTGREYNVAYNGDATFIVRAKYSGYAASPGCYSAGTSLTIEAFNAADLNSFDPTTCTYMTYDGQYAEVWMKSIESYKFPYVSNLGGTDPLDDFSYDAPGWRVSEDYDGAWSGSEVSINPFGPENDTVGVWASKRAKEVRFWYVGADIGTTDASFLPVSGQYSVDDTTPIVTSAYVFMAPCNGVVMKVVGKCESSSGTTTMAIYRVTGSPASSFSTSSNTTLLESVSLSVTADTFTTWTFGTSSAFVAGEMLALAIDGNTNPDQFIGTIVFEFDLPSIA